jgi:hypothetical protein
MGTTITITLIERSGQAWQIRAMRMLLALCLALFAAPALAAAGWSHYVNERFGVEADVPPGFVPGVPPVNGDGLGFSTPTAALSIYGSLIVEGDFESVVRQRMAWNEQDGWSITYQAVTPSWASWSGKQGSRIFYARAIRMCGGDMYGAFELEYSSADLKAFDPIVDRLVASLKDSGTGWQC